MKGFFSSPHSVLSMALVIVGLLVLAGAVALAGVSPHLGDNPGQKTLVYGYQGGENKLARMQTFHDSGIFEYETVGLLTSENLDSSVMENARMPRGALFQKYTYVIARGKCQRDEQKTHSRAANKSSARRK